MEKYDEKLAEFFPEDRSFAEAFKCLFENASDAIYILDKSGNFVTVNRKAEELTGFKREDFIGKSFRKIIPAKSLPKAIRGYLDVIRGKSIRLELELKTASEKAVLDEVSSTPFICNGKIVGAFGIVRDLTERKKTEEALKESEERYRSLVELAPDSIMTFNLDGVVTSCNTASTRLSGYSKDELVGKHFSELNFLLSREKDISKYLKVLPSTARGKVPKPLEVTYRHKNGTTAFGEVRFSLMREKGKIVGIQAIMRDITEQKKTEEALRESEEKYRELINGMNDTAWVIDFDCNFIDVNDAAVKVLGYCREELLSMGILDIDFSLDPEEIKGLVKGMPTDEIQVFETAHTTKDGKTIPVEISSSLVTYQGKQAILSIARDITERKQMEKKLEEYSQHLEELVEKRTRQLKEAQEKLIKSERLAAIGEVAATVGHDLRNPLTGIAGAVYYLKRKLDSEPDKTTREMLELIEENIEYSNNIIRDLLEYSIETKLELTETTPKLLMKEALSVVKVPSNIQILDDAQDEPKIMVDVERTKRVFVNIVKNAIDAMGKGGKLTVTSKEKDGNLEITFADTGIGMPKDILEKIWTPFFTTKAKGMELGLSICKRIVEAHGGDISVESTVGKGTIFTVTFPVQPKAKEEKGGEKVWVNVPDSLLSTTTKA